MSTRTRGCLALVAALLPTGILAAPAHAEPDRLLLSPDGQEGSFTETLSAPLFSGSYVPGTATEDFYVRNDSSSTARATISLAPTAPATPQLHDLEDSLSFSAAAGGVAGGSVRLLEDSGTSRCRTLVTGPTIAPGATQEIDVTMAIDPGFPQPAVAHTSSFSFVVTLSQVTRKSKVDACGAPSPPGGRAVRVLGTEASSAALRPSDADPPPNHSGRNGGLVAWLAAGLLGVGGLLLAGRRLLPAG